MQSVVARLEGKASILFVACNDENHPRRDRMCKRHQKAEQKVQKRTVKVTRFQSKDCKGSTAGTQYSVVHLRLDLPAPLPEASLVGLDEHGNVSGSVTAANTGEEFPVVWHGDSAEPNLYDYSYPTGLLVAGRGQPILEAISGDRRHVVCQREQEIGGACILSDRDESMHAIGVEYVVGVEFNISRFRLT